MQKREKMVEEIMASGGDTQKLAEIASQHGLAPGVVEVWRQIPTYRRAWGQWDEERKERTNDLRW